MLIKKAFVNLLNVKSWLTDWENYLTNQQHSVRIKTRAFESGGLEA